MKLKNLIREAAGNTLNEAAVKAIDAKKMTAIAKLVSDPNLFPELDGESLNPDSSMSEMKDTIQVIVKLPTVLNSGDDEKIFNWITKMVDKYGDDQVIWMNAENADQIEDPTMKSVFVELEEALKELRYCFADLEPDYKFEKAYNRLAKAVDKVLAAMGKNNASVLAGASKSGMWLAEKDINTEVNKAKKSIVAWAKSNGIAGTQLETLDEYILDLCQAYAQNQ